MNINSQASRTLAAPPGQVARSPVTSAYADKPSSAAMAEHDAKSAANAASGDVGVSPQQQAQQQQQITELASRDREVRSHEQAHAAVGGSYAGAPTYSFKRGPDGQAYAVGGEVSIDVSPIPNDPAATLRKMEVVQQAALAPAEPSAQDLRVAAQAQVLAAQARSELAALQREEIAAAAAERKAEAQAREEQEQAEQEEPAASEVQQQSFDLTPNLQLYRRLSQLQEPAALVDLVT
jgi:hypothetical protein